MNKPGTGEPDADEGRDELAQSDAVRRLEDVQVLKDIGDGHESKSSRKTET